MTQRQKIPLSDVIISSAHDIDRGLLTDFYSRVFPKRSDSLPATWEWLYRTNFYHKKAPQVILYQERIVGHCGMVPFDFHLDGIYYKGAWFVDFAVLPEFRRMGIGMMLIKKMMTVPDLCLTTCNEKSLAVNLKLGWMQDFDTFFHYHLIKPFNHPRLTSSLPYVIRTIGNDLSVPVFQMIYKKYTFPAENLQFHKIGNKIPDQLKVPRNLPENAVVPLRDSSYFKWRLLESPDRNMYRMVSCSSLDEPCVMIIKLNKKIDLRYIDILYLSGPIVFSTIRKMISALALWGRREGYAYIRQFTSSRELSNGLKKSLRSIVRPPVFTFYSKNNELMERLKHVKWNWELIDNDFENV